MDHSFIKVSGDEERAVKRGILGVLVPYGGGGSSWPWDILKRRYGGGLRNVKVSCSLSLRTILWRRGWGAAEVWLHAFLTSALYGCMWSASWPGSFIPSEKHRTRWIGGWVRPRAGLRHWGKRKTSFLCRVSVFMNFRFRLFEGTLLPWKWR